MRSASGQKRETVFQEIYENSFDQLFHFAQRLVPEHQAAKDIVQQCYLNLWQTPFEAGGLEDARRRLFVFVRNLVIDYQRKEATRQRFLRQIAAVGEPMDETESLQAKETKQAIEQAIEALPEKRKHIYKLSRYEGLSHDEISLQLSISKSTVNNQIASATEFLKERLIHFKS
jgi:RNA polymerase sigma-70 factor (ECF subfamily)